MSERGSSELASVEAFSQLPFIRPAPSSEPKPSNPRALRLFGFDFRQDPNSHPPEPKPKPKPTTADNNNTSNTNKSTDGIERVRKFECHYCCRNFPTSQALGGHQNAHKRERQHAKMALAAHHHHPPVADDHVYSLLNYHREVSAPSIARFTNFDPNYPSWNTASSTGSGVVAQFYGGLGSASRPINGSPVQGQWRVPAGASLGLIRPDRMIQLPLFGGDGSRVMAAGGGGGVASPSSSSTTLQQLDPNGYESGVKESLSLDLHL